MAHFMTITLTKTPSENGGGGRGCHKNGFQVLAGTSERFQNRSEALV